MKRISAQKSGRRKRTVARSPRKAAKTVQKGRVPKPNRANSEEKRAQTNTRVRRYREKKEFEARKHFDNVVRAAQCRVKRHEEPDLEPQSVLAFAVTKLAALMEWRRAVPLKKGLECGYFERNDRVAVWRSGNIVHVRPQLKGTVSAEDWVFFEAHDHRGRVKKATKNGLPRLIAVPAYNVVPLTEDIPRCPSGYTKFSTMTKLLARLACKIAKETRTARQWREVFEHTPRARQSRRVGPKSRKQRSKTTARR